MCGEGGIRTLGTVSHTPHFECGAFDHSATSPICSAKLRGAECSNEFVLLWRAFGIGHSRFTGSDENQIGFHPLRHLSLFAFAKSLAESSDSSIFQLKCYILGHGSPCEPHSLREWVGPRKVGFAYLSVASLGQNNRASTLFCSSLGPIV